MSQRDRTVSTAASWILGLGFAAWAAYVTTCYAAQFDFVFKAIAKRLTW